MIYDLCIAIKLPDNPEETGTGITLDYWGRDDSLP